MSGLEKYAAEDFLLLRPDKGGSPAELGMLLLLL